MTRITSHADSRGTGRWLTWPCPRCGRPTTGSYSEGGTRWALCADCLDAERREPDHGPRERRRLEGPPAHVE
jgi:hypothetical protein